MNILVCVKRVPDTGARIDVTSDAKDVDTRNLGFTISPHEECAVEEAVRIVESTGGIATVLTLGPSEAEEQLRESLARGIDKGILLQTDGEAWDPGQTTAAIAEAIGKTQDHDGPFDLILFGNESADSGNYQIGIRVAHLLDLPSVTGIKRLEVDSGRIIAKRETAIGWERYEAELPAVVTVKEGLNLPRHPSLKGTITARKKPIDIWRPSRRPVALELLRLRLPAQRATGATMFGDGNSAIPGILKILEEVGSL